jgi:hypothetical protein
MHRVSTSGGSVLRTVLRGLPLVLLTFLGTVFLVSAAFALWKDIPPVGDACGYEFEGSPPSTAIGNEAIVWGLVPEVECRYPEALPQREFAVAGPLIGFPLGLIAGGAAYAFASGRWRSGNAEDAEGPRKQRA